MLEMLKARKEALEARGRKGFTLMEMLIVIAIIAVLVAIAIPVFSAQLDTAKQSADEANARSMFAVIAADYAEDGDVDATVTIPATIPTTGFDATVGSQTFTFSDKTTALTYTAPVAATQTTTGSGPIISVTTNAKEFTFGA